MKLHPTAMRKAVNAMIWLNEWFDSETLNIECCDTILCSPLLSLLTAFQFAGVTVAGSHDRMSNRRREPNMVTALKGST
jgi:hypothetical protein